MRPLVSSQNLTKRHKMDARNEILEEILAAVSATSLAAVGYKAGFANYSDVATQTAPITVTGGAGAVYLTNDGAGTLTSKTYLPQGVTDVWNAIAGSFDFTQLKLGDAIDIRLDLDVTTTSSNQLVDVELELGSGAGLYSMPFASCAFKDIGEKSVSLYNGIYIGDANTLNGGGKFKVSSSDNATVMVNGWYCKILIR